MTFNYKSASKRELKKKWDQIAEEMGDDQFFTKKELNHLPEVLREGEQVLGFTSGLMGGNTWLITLTDRRIIFLDKGMIYGLKQQIVDLDKVNAISGSTGMLFGKIGITDGASEKIVTNVWKKTVNIFTSKAQEALEARKLMFMTSAPVQSQENDPYAKLEKLASLREKGILSDEEFEAEKKKVLSM